MMVRTLAIATFLTAGLVGEGFANEVGPGATGFANRVSCGQCHNRTGRLDEVAPLEFQPEVTVTALTDALRLDEPATLRISFRSRIGGGAGRGVGFGVVATEQEVFGFDWPAEMVVLDEDRTHETPMGIGHTRPLPYEGTGSVTIEVGIVPRRHGPTQVFVAGNDVNLNGRPDADDYPSWDNFCYGLDGAAPSGNCTKFVVYEDPAAPEPEVETPVSMNPAVAPAPQVPASMDIMPHEEATGCGATPGASLWFVFAMLPLIRRRRV